MRSVFSRLAERLSEDEPRHEAEVRDVVADVLRDVLGLRRTDVRTEHRVGAKLLDVWAEPTRIAIEVKYHRPIPSGRSRPMTQQFGDLLADVRKLAGVADAHHRLLMLLSDSAGVTHLRNKGLLPISEAGPRVIAAAGIARLAASARWPAESEGEWQEVRVALVWNAQLSFELTGLAWQIEVVAPAS